jgi:hypothetical protein
MFALVSEGNRQVFLPPAARQSDRPLRRTGVTLLEQWGVPLAVLGMLLLTLFMAAVVSRYQAYQADVRVAVRHLYAHAAELVAALAELGRVPLSRELRLTLRSEVLATYRKIRKLNRRCPGIAEEIRKAEYALNAEGAPLAGGVGPMESEQAFHKIIAALDCLISNLGRGGTLQAVPADVRAIFCRELGERRAEAMSRHHLVEAKHHERSGNTTRARTHLMALMQALRQRGPSTEFVRELYAEAESALSGLNDRQLKSDIVATDADAA